MISLDNIELTAEFKKLFPKLTKVKKQHRCRLCDEIIMKNDHVAKWVTFTGGPQSWYAHPGCYQVTLNWRWTDLDWEMCMPGDFNDYLEDAKFDDE